MHQQHRNSESSAEQLKTSGVPKTHNLCTTVTAEKVDGVGAHQGKMKKKKKKSAAHGEE